MTVFRHTVNVDTGASSANLRELEQNSDRLERSLRSAEDRAGRFGTASTKLAGILGRISPALGETAMMANDLADGFEVATMGGARVLAVLGPVAAAAGVAAGAYFVLKGRLDEANEAMKVSAERATEMQRINEQVAVTTRLAQLANEEMTQAEFNRLAAAESAEDLFAAQVENGKGRVNVLNEEREAIEKQIAATKERIALDAARVGTGSSEEQALDKIVSALGLDPQERLDQLNQELANNVRLTNNAQFQLGNLDRAQADHAKNLETVANSTRTVTAATVEMAAAMASVPQAFDPNAIGQTLRPNADTVQSVQTSDILARDKSVTDAMIASAAADNAASIGSKISGGLNAAANPMGALSALGPAGAVLGGLSTIGKLGADGVEKQLDSVVDSIADGVRALPAILLDVFPDLVVMIVTELPKAIAESIADLFIRIINFLPGVNIDPDDPESQSKIASIAALLGSMGGSKGELPTDLAVEQERARQKEAANRQASSRGRMARASGASRLAMSRAPTAAMMAQPSVTINALGIDDGTQDQFQRTFARYTDSNTGLRGRS